MVSQSNPADFLFVLSRAHSHFRALASDALLPVHADAAARLFRGLWNVGVRFSDAVMNRVRDVSAATLSAVDAGHAPVLWAELMGHVFSIVDPPTEKLLTTAWSSIFAARCPGQGWGFQRGRVSSVPATCRILCGLLNLSDHRCFDRYCDPAYDALRWLASEWEHDLSPSAALPFKGGFFLSTVAAASRAGQGDYDVPSPLIAATVDYLSKSQLPNGAWTFLLPTNPVEELQLPLSSPVYTAIVSRGLLEARDTGILSTAANLASEVEVLLRAGRGFLLDSLHPSGFWPCATNDVFTATLAIGLEVLHRAARACVEI